MVEEKKSLLARFFKRGLRALLPTVLTLAVLLFVYRFFAENIVNPLNRGIRVLLTDSSPGHSILDGVFGIDVESDPYIKDPGLPPERSNIDWKKVNEDLEDIYPGWLEALVGFVAALLLVFLAGFLLATFVGKKVLGRFESVMARFPVVKVIYPYARQIVEFLMREKAVKFNSVVAVEYPRKGLYSVGFVTGNGMKVLSREAEGEFITVFLPSAPTPVTGWAFFVNVKDVISIPMTVDEAIRFCISCGVLLPESQQNPDSVLDRFKDLHPPTLTQDIALPEEVMREIRKLDEEGEGEKREDTAGDGAE